MHEVELVLVSLLVAVAGLAAAAPGGGFSIKDAGMEFVLGATGGILIGLAVGALIAEIRRRVDDIPVEITISCVTLRCEFHGLRPCTSQRSWVCSCSPGAAATAQGWRAWYPRANDASPLDNGTVRVKELDHL